VSKATPKGLLRVNETLGFGRCHVAPLISRFVRKHPQMEVQLQLSVSPPALTDDTFDVCIRFGAPRDTRIIAKYIAPNRRRLCAAPAYLTYPSSTSRWPRSCQRRNWPLVSRET
jgi:LysR family transcriptional regulator, transcriptional activator for dmlA